MNDYLISVVIPIYNTERYLRETIESVLHQTIGFKDNIQLILVNNETPDDSEIICKEYVSQYPNNIEYVKVKENHGPCSARNAGMKIAKGKYITFLDSDDKWNYDAFKIAIDFFDKHHEEIDIVACRIKHFDAFSDYDLFDFKFDRGNRIVSIFEEPECIQFSLCSALIKRDVAIKYVHDERIRHAEDMKYLTEIIFERGRYGICSDALFYYRMRLSRNSTLDTTGFSDNWYVETIKYAYKYLISLSQKKYGGVIRYLQYILLSEVRGRLEKEIPDKYDKHFIATYRRNIRYLLRNIEDELILNESHLIKERKLFALSLKYGDSYTNHITKDGNLVMFDQNQAVNLNHLLYLRSVLVIEDMVIITGFIRYLSELGNIKLIIEAKYTRDIKLILSDLTTKNDVFSLNKKICKGKAFRLCLPHKSGETISFFIKMGEESFRQKLQLLDFHTVNSQLLKIGVDEIQMTGTNGNSFPSYYLFPYEYVKQGSRICIYGNGYIGHQYLEQLRLSKYCEIVAIVDKTFSGIHNEDNVKLVSPKSIVDYDFDKIVIALGKREIVAEVIEYLAKIGISKEKILVDINRMIPWS